MHTLPIEDGPETNAGEAVMEAGAMAAAADAVDAGDTQKRRDILEGARQVFRAQGFDGASMGEIAKAAGVSKGTLYVYFENKVALFEALVKCEWGEAAERAFRFDEADPDVRGALTRIGVGFVTMMIRPDHIALVRMVMSAAEKVPGGARKFYEMGPRAGTRRLAAYLGTQVAAGRLVIDDDLDLAAAHFLHLAQGNLMKERLFGAGEEPTEASIAATVASAVRVFFAAYGPDRR